MTTTSLEDRAVLITGASRGLGRALALESARRGARVGLVGRTAETLEAVAAEIRARGGEAHVFVADISDPRAIHPLAGQAHALLGTIDVLINNASDLGPTPLRPLLDTECEDFEAVLQTNLLGPFRLAKALLGPMQLRGSGTVVNISSDAAVEAYPTWGAYGVSKAALDHLTRIWAVELAERDSPGIHIVSIDPGEMDTQLHVDAIPEADPATLQRPENVARKLLDRIEQSGSVTGAPARFSLGEAVV